MVNCKNNQELVKKECFKCITKCNPDQERNPLTGRCKKIKTSKKTYKKKTPKQTTRKSTPKQKTPSSSSKSSTPPKSSISSKSSIFGPRTPSGPPSPSPKWSRTHTPLLTVQFQLKNKQYKALHRDMNRVAVIVKNYKQKRERKMNINIYPTIYDMDDEEDEINLTFDDNGTEIYVNVIELDNQFYFYDSDNILYDNQGEEVGTYSAPSTTGRAKGNRGLGKNISLGEIIFDDDNSVSNSSKSSSYKFTSPKPFSIPSGYSDESVFK